MQLLNDIIAEHFLPPQVKSIKKLLEKHNLYETLDSSNRYLKRELENAHEDGSGVPLNKILASAGNLLIGTNTITAGIADNEEKTKLKKLVAEIAIRMLFSVIKQFPEDAREITEALKETLHSLAIQRSYDQHDIDSLLDIDGVAAMAESITGEEAANQITISKKASGAYLIWTQRVDIGVLSAELLRRKWIKSERNFWKLFDGPEEKEIKISCNLRYKWQIAHLIHRLYAEDYIRTEATKGHFKLLQDRMIGFNNEELPANALKKMSSKVSKDKILYREIVSAVNEIFTTISTRIIRKGDD